MNSPIYDEKKSIYKAIILKINIKGILLICQLRLSLLLKYYNCEGPFFTEGRGTGRSDTSTAAIRFPV